MRRTVDGWTRTVRRGVVVVTVIAAGFSGEIVNAGAELAPSRCTCGSQQEQIDHADAVFVGTVRDLNADVNGPAGRETLWNIDVETSFVGPHSTVIAVSTGAELSNCAVELEPGDHVGIVAFWTNGHLATSRCGVSTPDVLSRAFPSPNRGAGSILVLAGLSALGVAGLAFLWGYRQRGARS